MSQNTSISRRPNQVDSVRFSRSLIVTFLFILTVILGSYVVRSGNLVFMLGLVALPFVLILMNKPAIALTLAVLMDATQYQIPGMSLGSIGLFAKLLLVVSGFLAVLMGVRLWKRNVLPENKPMLFFAGVILSLMAFRGAGLRFLGSSTWGGMMYINLFIGLLVFYFLNGLTVSKKHMKWIVWGSVFMGLIGSFLQYGGYAAESGEMSEVASGRLMYMIPFTTALFPLGFALTWKKKWVGNLIILTCIGLIALTGFRSRLVGLLAVWVGFGFFIADRKVAFFFKMVILGCLGWTFLVVISSHLPSGMQRAISFVPGVNIGLNVAGDALNSIEWRLEIWKYCWGQLPDYLLVGRGSTFNVFEASGNLSSNDIATFTPWFAFETRSYHSGPLSLLLDYGVFGFLSAGWLMILFFKRFWSYASRLARLKTLTGRFALVLCVTMLWKIFAFYAVYGDIRGFANLLGLAAITMVICNSVLANQKMELVEDLDDFPDLNQSI